MSTAVPNAPQHSTSMSRRFQFDFSSYCMTHTFMSSLSHVSWHVTSCMHIHARGSMQSHSWNFSGCIHGCPRAQFANCTAPSIWGPRACVSYVSLCALSGLCMFSCHANYIFCHRCSTQVCATSCPSLYVKYHLHNGVARSWLASMLVLPPPWDDRW